MGKSPAKRKPKKPAGPGHDGEPRQQVLVRLSDPLLAAIDSWCMKQMDRPSRAEALRRFAVKCLAEDK